MVQMIQVFMEDYTEARRGISFIETSFTSSPPYD